MTWESVLAWAGSDLVWSIVLVLALLGMRTALVWVIRSRAEVLSEGQRRWINRIKDGAWLAGAIGLVLIWGTQLQSFLLSLTAVAVALVIATKELILCVSGSVLRATTNAYEVGDWIEIGSTKGEVVEVNMFATTLQEIDFQSQAYNYTGRTLVVPNSVLLSTAVRNENFMKKYVLHEFAITLEGPLAPNTLERLVLDFVRLEREPFREVARRYNKTIRRMTGVPIMGPEPSVNLSTTDLGKVRVSTSVFCPTREAARIEQAVTRKVLSAVAEGTLATATGTHTVAA